jgi:hypothetical protein
MSTTLPFELAKEAVTSRVISTMVNGAHFTNQRFFRSESADNRCW